MLKEMIDTQVVKVVKKKPTCVNPLGLVSKNLSDGSIKHRLVWDGSRYVNKLLKEQHVRLSHLEKALELTKKDDYQVIFDLTNAYYHIKINPKQTKYLGACFEDEQGQAIYIEYQVLPFGLASAVHAITKMFKPIVAYLTEKDVRMTIYIDDGRILAESQEKIEQARVETYNILTRAGWSIAKHKSDGQNEGAKTKKYLGFKIDTKQMKISVEEEKLNKLAIQIDGAIRNQFISIKELASIVGKITALEPSHGMMSRISTRSSYDTIGFHTEQVGWKGYAPMTQYMRDELAFFKEHIHESNGTLIKSTLTQVRVDTILKNPVAMKEFIPNHERADTILVSDSSEIKAFAYNLTNNSSIEVEVNFSEEEKKLSSAARELLALDYTVKQWKEKGFKNMKVYWLTDSSSAAACIQKGSKSSETQHITFGIVKLCKELGIHVTPIHLRREDPRIQMADDGSKIKNSDNWSIDSASFNELNEIFKFEMDLFADEQNAKTRDYCSLYFQKTAVAIEAFSTNWSEFGMCWICPPISLLIQVNNRIQTSQCKGVIILPVWKTSSFYTYFLNENEFPKEPYRLVKKWHPYIIQNEGVTRTPLFGITPFKFVALAFNTFK